MIMQSLCRVGTTQQIVRQLHQEGYQVSEYALRRWLAEGAIPSVSSGKKRLLVYAHVIEFLTTGSVVLEPVKASI